MKIGDKGRHFLAPISTGSAGKGSGSRPLDNHNAIESLFDSIFVDDHGRKISREEYGEHDDRIFDQFIGLPEVLVTKRVLNTGERRGVSSSRKLAGSKRLADEVE